MERLMAILRLLLTRVLAIFGLLPWKQVDVAIMSPDLVSVPNERIVFGTGRKTIKPAISDAGVRVPGPKVWQQRYYADLARRAFIQGRFDDCESLLARALAVDTAASDLTVHMLGYLGCIQARNNDYVGARKAFEDCCRNVEWLISCDDGACCQLCQLERQVRRCWAVGNLAITLLQLSSISEDEEDGILLRDEAIDRFAEQFEMAHNIIKGLRRQGASEIKLQLLARAKLCQSFAMNRLVICYAHRGNQSLSLRLAKQACRLSDCIRDHEAPEVSHICHAQALSTFGMREEAGREVAFLLQPGTTEIEARQQLMAKAEKIMQPALWRGDLSGRKCRVQPEDGPTSHEALRRPKPHRAAATVA